MSSSSASVGRRASGANALFPTRQQMRKTYGLDCTEELTWLGWSAGADIEKKLVMKNISGDVIKLAYKLPETKYFFMEFPSIITLSPGMSCTITVNFRPLKEEEYLDSIEWKMLTGKHAGSIFLTKMQALLPKLHVTCVSSVEFGFVAVGETASATFDLVNDGQLNTTFSIKQASPFVVSPSSGDLKAGTSVTITATIIPTAAALARSTVQVDIPGLASLPVQLSATAKFAFLELSDSLLQFGGVLSGTEVTRTLQLSNRTVVPTIARLTHVTPDTGSEQKSTTKDHVFTVTPQEIQLKPGETVPVTVSYRPCSAGLVSREHFRFTNASGSSAAFECSGKAEGATVSVSSTFVEFGDVKLGQSAHKPLTLHNHSSRPLRFRFVDDNSGSFSFQHTEGVIPGHLSLNLTITFHPKAAHNFYRHVFLLVEQAAPLSIELSGTSFSDGARPAPLTKRHVRLHQYRVQQVPDLACKGPTELAHALQEVQSTDLSVAERLQNASRDLQDDPDVLDGTLSAASVTPQAAVGAVENLSVQALYTGLFGHFDEQSSEATIAEKSVEFGSASATRLNENKTIHVTNRSTAKLVCVWDTADVPVSETGEVIATAVQPKFLVFPKQQDILPGETVSFQVSFRPGTANRYYAQLLQCYCFYKPYRTFRLVDDNAFVPPRHLVITVSGNSFAPGVPQFLANVSLSHPVVQFPPCLLQESSHQTVLLSNHSDTPLKYVVNKPYDDSNSEIRVFPHTALVQPHSFGLLVLRFCPSRLGQLRRTVTMTLNNSANDTVSFDVNGLGCAPTIELEDSSRLYFKPTCQLISSTRQHAIQNTSLVPISFEWSVPERYRHVLEVQPERGVLQGNERLLLQWRFQPKDVQTYQITPVCTIKPAATSAARPEALTRTYALNVFGEGVSGIVRLQPELVDFGTVQLLRDASRPVRLVNDSDCAVSYKLFYAIKHTDSPLEYLPLPQTQNQASLSATQRSSLLNVLSADAPEGDVPAHTQLPLALTLNTRRMSSLQFVLQCRVLESVEDGKEGRVLFVTEAQVNATAWFPQLRISDARIEGLSLASSWLQLSVDTLNDTLSRPLTVEETMIAGGDAEQALNSSHVGLEQQPITLHMGIAELQEPAAMAYIVLDNPAPLPVDWSFRISSVSEGQAELERWADPGDSSHEQLRLEAIIQHKLFTVQPEGGLLQPGQSCVVRVAYRNKFSGKFVVPATLAISGGKVLNLRLAAETIGSFNPQLYLLPHEEVHTFADTVVGLTEDETPIQSVPLRNPTGYALRYKLDSRAINLLNEQSFGFPVISCVNPTGVIPASSTAQLLFKFCPLEAKDYTVQIELDVWADDSDAATEAYGALITLHGSGKMPGDERLRCLLPPLPQSITEQGVEVPLTHQPSHSSLLRSGQSVHLSSEVIDFGTFPTQSGASRLVSVSNTSQTRAAHFSWQSTNHSSLVSLSVEPSAGKLAPGQTIPCFINLSSTHTPIVLDGTLSCEIVYEDEPNEQNDGQKSWEGHALADAHTSIDIAASTNFKLHDGPSVDLTDGTHCKSGTGLGATRISVVDYMPAHKRQYLLSSTQLKQWSGEDEAVKTIRRGPSRVYLSDTGVPIHVEHPDDPFAFMERERVADVLLCRLVADIKSVSQLRAHHNAFRTDSDVALAESLHPRNAYTLKPQEPISGEGLCADDTVVKSFIGRVTADIISEDAFQNVLASLPVQQPKPLLSQGEASGESPSARVCSKAEAAADAEAKQVLVQALQQAVSSAMQ